MTIRRATAADVDALRRAGDERILHHEERFARQGLGDCDDLLALEDDAVVGHVVVRRHSKYQPVLDHLGELPEVQALAADPPGRGTGRALLEAAIEVAGARHAPQVGLAVDQGNERARRLYERRGFRPWPDGLVIDDWDEVAPDGSVVASHHEVCEYLLLDLR